MRRRSVPCEKQREWVRCLVAKPFVASATAVVTLFISADLQTFILAPPNNII